MPRHGRKADKCLNNKKSLKADMSDVTINDYANSVRTSTTTRLKKNCINVVVKEGKDFEYNQFKGDDLSETYVNVAVKNLNLSKHDQTWDKTLDDIECVTEGYGDEQFSAVKKSNNRRRKKIVQEVNSKDEVGVIYPQEIWFLIAQFIKPEDVGRFAGICRGCLGVVSTSNFWYNMYKRFYKKVDNLPVRLQPEYMVRNYGLRAHVIRALYFMYPPFINKVKPQVIFDGDPHVLTKRQCVLSWSQKNKNQWLFYFKLKQSSGMKFGRSDCESEVKPNLLDMLEDITANVDDKCKVLQVTCLDYIPLPMIYGQTLSSVSLTLSHNMLYHRLQLNFGSGLSPYMGNNLVVLDPVVNLKVLDWWHPSFPHSDTPMSILSSSESGIPFEEHEF